MRYEKLHSDSILFNYFLFIVMSKKNTLFDIRLLKKMCVPYIVASGINGNELYNSLDLVIIRKFVWQKQSCQVKHTQLMVA